MRTKVTVGFHRLSHHKVMPFVGAWDECFREKKICVLLLLPIYHIECDNRICKYGGEWYVNIQMQTQTHTFLHAHHTQTQTHRKPAWWYSINRTKTMAKINGVLFIIRLCMSIHGSFILTSIQWNWMTCLCPYEPNIDFSQKKKFHFTFNQ